MQKPSRSAWAVAAYLFLTPAVAIAGALGFAPLQAACGLVGAPWKHLHRQAMSGWPFLALLGAFGVWAAASALWSPVETAQGWRVLGALGCGLLFVASANGPAESRRLIRSAALAAAITLAAFALIEASYNMPLNRLGQPNATDPNALMRNPGRGVSVLVMLFWAALGGWASGGGSMRAIGWLMAPIVAWMSFGFGMAANFVSFAAGLVAFAFGMIAPRIALQTITAALAVWLLAAPWIMPALLDRVQAYFPTLPDSWEARMEIWRFVSARIAEHPWIGMGLDASHSFAGQMTQIQGATQVIVHERVPLHPHNVGLHIWLDTGLVGAALAAGALVVGGWMGARALNAQRTAIASACAAMIAVAVQWSVSFGAWQEWLIASAFACVALVAGSRR